MWLCVCLGVIVYLEWGLGDCRVDVGVGVFPYFCWCANCGSGVVSPLVFLFCNTPRCLSLCCVVSVVSVCWFVCSL